MKSRVFALIFAVLTAPVTALADFPNRPVRLVVPFPAGGSTDVVARLVANSMSATLRQQVLVENKPGAATIIGTDSVAKAAADGYTVLLSTATSLTINPHVQKKLPYSPDDFRHVGMIGEAPIVLVSPITAKARTLNELTTELRHPDRETLVATTGKGGFAHVAAAMYFTAIGARFRDVPYRGEAPALQDLIAGQVPLYFGSLPGTLPQVNAGKLRAFGVTASERSPAASSVPTFLEQGLDVVATAWFGLSVPRGTPEEAVRALGAALALARDNAELVARLATDGASVRKLSGVDFADFIRRDSDRWQRVVRAARVEAD